MKIIILFVAALTISGCTTPFHEYHNQSGPAIVEKSLNPQPAPVVEPIVKKTDEEKEVKTFAIDLDRN